MPDNYHELDELSPRQILAMLAQAISAHSRDGKEAQELLVEYFCTLYVARTGQVDHSLYLLPDKTEYERFAGFADDFTAIFQRAKEGVSPKQIAELPANAVPLIDVAREWSMSGLTALLVRDHSDDQEERRRLKRKASHTRLFMRDDDISEADIVILVERIRRQATAVAIAKTTEHYFLYVQDDRKRGSTFSGMQAAGALNNWQSFSGFIVLDQQQIFLPRGLTPTAPGLESYAHILYALPSLFTAEDRRRNNPLAVIVPDEQPVTDDTSRFVLCYLAALDFTDPNKTIPFPNANFFSHRLTQTEAEMGKLYAAFQTNTPHTGYYMRIQATRFAAETNAELIEQERDRLKRRIDNLNEELYELNEIAYVKKDYLLRFTQAQFSTFCKYLSQRSGFDLRNRKLLYAFQETEKDPQGLHYLYISGELTEPVVNTLLTEGEYSQLSPIQFWQDPFWVKHYGQGAGNKSQVFVPRNTFLSPTLHCWNESPGEIDAYLRDIIRAWLREHSESDDIQQKGNLPDKPIYIFDGKADAAENIDVYVLNRDEFQPLCTKLSWFNDNLALQKPANNHSIRQQIANDMTWANMAAKIEDHKTRQQTRFEQAHDETYNLAAKRTEKLTIQLSQKIRSLIEQTDRQQQKIAQLQRRLNEVNIIYEQIERTVGQAERQRQAVQDQIDHGDEQRQTIAATLEQFKIRVAETDRTTRQTMDDLDETVKTKQDEIYDLIAQLEEIFNEQEETLTNLRNRKKRS